MEDLVDQELDNKFLLSKNSRLFLVLGVLMLVLASPVLGNIVVDYAGDFIVEENTKLDMGGDRMVDVGTPEQPHDVATRAWVVERVPDNIGAGTNLSIENDTLNGRNVLLSPNGEGYELNFSVKSGSNSEWKDKTSDSYTSYEVTITNTNNGNEVNTADYINTTELEQNQKIVPTSILKNEYNIKVNATYNDPQEPALSETVTLPMVTDIADLNVTYELEKVVGTELYNSIFQDYADNYGTDRPLLRLFEIPNPDRPYETNEHEVHIPVEIEGVTSEGDTFEITSEALSDGGTSLDVSLISPDREKGPWYDRDYDYNPEDFATLHNADTVNPTVTVDENTLEGASEFEDPLDIGVEAELQYGGTPLYGYIIGGNTVSDNASRPGADLYVDSSFRVTNQPLEPKTGYTFDIGYIENLAINYDLRAESKENSLEWVSWTNSIEVPDSAASNLIPEPSDWTSPLQTSLDLMNVYAEDEAAGRDIPMYINISEEAALNIIGGSIKAKEEVSVASTGGGGGSDGPMINYQVKGATNLPGVPMAGNVALDEDGSGSPDSQYPTRPSDILSPDPVLITSSDSFSMSFANNFETAKYSSTEIVNAEPYSRNGATPDECKANTDAGEKCTGSPLTLRDFMWGAEAVTYDVSVSDTSVIQVSSNSVSSGSDGLAEAGITPISDGTATVTVSAGGVAASQDFEVDLN